MHSNRNISGSVGELAYPRFTVRQLFAATRKPCAKLSACNLVIVISMQRLAGKQHHVVCYVNYITNGANTDSRQFNL